MVVRYNQIINDGNRLLKIYVSCVGSNQNIIKTIESLLFQLDRKWETFLQLVDQRKRLLMLSLSTYQKCNLVNLLFQF